MEQIYLLLIAIFLIGTVGVFSITRFYINKQVNWDSSKNRIDLPDFSILGAHGINAGLTFLVAALLLGSRGCDSDNASRQAESKATQAQYEMQKAQYEAKRIEDLKELNSELKNLFRESPN